MTYREIGIGEIYMKRGERRPRYWQVERLIDLPEGPHARLVCMDDPGTTKMLAVDALLDRRLMVQLE